MSSAVALRPLRIALSAGRNAYWVLKAAAGMNINKPEEKQCGRGADGQNGGDGGARAGRGGDGGRHGVQESLERFDSHVAI